MRQRGATAGQPCKKFEALKDINRASSIEQLKDLVCPIDRCAAGCVPVCDTSREQCSLYAASVMCRRDGDSSSHVPK
jgi:hypothetical protein